MSQVRQNYHEEAESEVNKCINRVLQDSYAYLSMSFHFERDDVALPNAVKHFRYLSEERLELAHKLMKFQTDRGGRVVLQNIGKPEKDSWGTLAEATKSALDLEKASNQSMMDLHTVAHNHHDHNMSDFVEELLGEYVEEIKELADHVAGLKIAGPGLGEYLFDKETLGEHK